MHAGGAGLLHALGKMLPGQMLLLQDWCPLQHVMSETLIQ